jgi:hypothetical protein
MQKPKGISSGQNNKSCSIIHNESKKIGSTFFWIFCDFLRNLQESAKLLYYWSYLFAIKTLERNWALQCGPYRGRPARACQFRRGRRPWPGGSGPGRVEEGLGFGLGAWTGWRWPAVGYATVAGGGRRWSSWSGAVGRLCGGAARLWVVAGAKGRGEWLVWCLAGPAGSSPWRPANGAGGGLTAARPRAGGRHPF